MTLVVATTNRHKLAEIARVLEGLDCAVEPISAHANAAPPEETGRTFAENARLKALYYGRLVPHLTVADDSGIEIDGLDGEPGVRSARFGGPTYPEKFDLIYERLRARAALGSPARFVCAVAVAEARARGVRGAWDDRGTHRRPAGRGRRLRLRPDLLLPAVRLHARRGLGGAEGGGQPPRAGVPRVASVPRGAGGGGLRAEVRGPSPNLRRGTAPNSRPSSIGRSGRRLRGLLQACWGPGGAVRRRLAGRVGGARNVVAALRGWGRGILLDGASRACQVAVRR